MDEEERAYLRQVQAFTFPEAPIRPRRPLSRQQQQQQQQRRSWYYTPSNSSTPTPDKLRSTPDVPLDTNPWAPPIPHAGSSLSQSMANDSSSSDDDDRVTSSLSRPRSRTTSPRQQQQQQRASLIGRLPAFQGSPAYSTSSSATATARNTQHLRTSNRATPELSVISLGPVTKRALESLQAEVIALNARIDDLRKELTDRDQQRRTSAAPTPIPLSAPPLQQRSIPQLPRRDDENDEDDSWKWVIKASLVETKGKT